MKKQEFEDICNALLKIGTSRPKKMTDREFLACNGMIMGFMMWLDEYYEEHKED